MPALTSRLTESEMLENTCQPKILGCGRKKILQSPERGCHWLTGTLYLKPPGVQTPASQAAGTEPGAEPGRVPDQPELNLL